MYEKAAFYWPERDRYKVNSTVACGFGDIKSIILITRNDKMKITPKLPL